MTMRAQQPSPIPEPVPPPGDPLPPGVDPEGPVPVEEPPSADPTPFPDEDDEPPLRVTDVGTGLHIVRPMRGERETA